MNSQPGRESIHDLQRVDNPAVTSSLAGSNALLLFTIDTAIDAVYIVDEARNIIYANATACEQTGWSRDELLQMNVAALDPETPEDKRREIWASARRGERTSFETRHRRKDGSSFPVEVSHSVAAFDGRWYCGAFVRDLSARKAAMRAFDQLQFAVDNAPDAIYCYDADGRIVYASQGAARALGYGVEELLQMSIADLDPGFNPDVNRALLMAELPLAKLAPLEARYRRKDGSSYPVEILVSMTERDGQRYAAAIVRDITERRRIERSLRLTQFAVDHNGDAVFFSDADGRILYANETACRERGYSREELLGMNVAQIDAEVHAQRLARRAIWDDLRRRGSSTLQSVHLRRDGSRFPVELRISILDFEGSQISCSVVRDISERVRAEQALRDSEQRFRIIADASPIVLLICRLSDGRVRYANTQAELLFGGPLTGASGTTLQALWRRFEAGEEIIATVMAGTQVHGAELRLQRDPQPPMWLSLNTRTIELQGEQVVCCVMLDITRARELASQLAFHATYDALTGLVNRREFEERLQRIITESAPGSSNVLCYLDLDQFKVINDTCGHIAGDELLRQIAQAFRSRVRKHDTLARLGGDEFAILLTDCSLAQAERIATAIREKVQDFSFAWAGKTFRVGVSIGVVPIGGEGETMTAVLQRADSACYAAKDRGRNRIHVYSTNDQELAQRRGEMQWVARITAALEQDRMRLWAQPIRPLAERGEGEHFEVLVRMLDEHGQIVAPGAFLPAAERYNLASRIDRWVTRATFAWLKRNPERCAALGVCAINLSGQSLGDDDFMADLLRRLGEGSVPPHKICFEITETAAVANLARALQFIQALRRLGCRFALDDFGSGLSSFAYLKTLPVDYLKIDGQFVRDIAIDPIDRTMVQSINEVGHVLGKQTIAEFVESEEILAILRKLGVDYVQGYGVAPPGPLAG